MASSFVIRTPCSSANIGPGFDVIGLALSLHLDIHVTIDPSKGSSTFPLNCAITYEDQSKSTEQISLDPEVNLITRVALYVLRCHELRAFPVETSVHIVNPIPLGRGLGSSGTAVVAGVMLANEVGKLGLSKDRLLDYCLMIGTWEYSSIWGQSMPMTVLLLPRRRVLVQTSICTRTYSGNNRNNWTLHTSFQRSSLHSDVHELTCYSFCRATPR